MKKLAAFVLVVCLGCETEPAAKKKAASPGASAAPAGAPSSPDAAPKPDSEKKPDGASKKAALGNNVFLENPKNGPRRVLVNATVCLREGPLEQLLCRKNTKEHEAILTAAVDARDIHKALLVAGAQPGSPVRYQPQYQPASGSRIKVSVQYEDKGKTVTVPARTWVRSAQTKKDLDQDWVFAGSMLIEDPDKVKPPFYAANYGDVICVSNFEDAMLDLPINSSKDNADLTFEANTERIPPVGTPVVVILEPVAK